MKQLMLLLEESQASKEAKAKGLEYLGFGRYGKRKGETATVTHTVSKGKLVPVKKPSTISQKAGHDSPLHKGEPIGQERRKLTPMTSEPHEDNFWRDQFYRLKGRVSDAEVQRILKSHPRVKKAFLSLSDPKQYGGAYIVKDKNGDWVWPEQQDQ